MSWGGGGREAVSWGGGGRAWALDRLHCGERETLPLTSCTVVGRVWVGEGRG